MSGKIYEMVTQSIIDKLEAGVVPWRKPWVGNGSVAVSWKTQKPYRGINTLLLEPGEYATFKQITQSGGKVKKGEKGSIVVFWKWLEKEDKETKEIEKIPMLRYYKVFEINRQCEGLESKRKEEEESFEHDPIAEAEKVIMGYKNAPLMVEASGRAFYRPSQDLVSVPPIEDYPIKEEYYSTFFHELIHSTGSEKRLKRKGILELNSFGSESYSKEELVAEMGSAMLCGTCGIDNTTIDNQASYINGWLRALKEDSKMLIQSAQQAQKASDHILGIEFKKDE